MRYSKKGQITKVLIEMALVLMLLFFTIKLSVALFGMVAQSKEGQITMSNFEGLSNQIYNMIDNKDKFVAERNFPFYIEPEYVIVGFSKGVSEVRSTCFPPLYGVSEDNINEFKKSYPFHFDDGRVSIKKPFSQCGNAACLCLYKSDIQVPGPTGVIYKAIGVEPVRCVTFENVDKFFSYRTHEDNENALLTRSTEINFRGDYLGNNDLGYYTFAGSNLQTTSLAVWGKCALRPLVEVDKGTSELGVVNLYLEKYENNGNHLLIIPDQSLIDKRYNDLSAKS